MPARTFRLSKTSYVAGLQCVKQLWWRMHEPGAAELVPDEGLAERFEQGHDVGARAREFVPGGTLTGGPEVGLAQRLEATRAAVEEIVAGLGRAFLGYAPYRRGSAFVRNTSHD